MEELIRSFRLFRKIEQSALWLIRSPPLLLTDISSSCWLSVRRAVRVAGSQLCVIRLVQFPFTRSSPYSVGGSSILYWTVRAERGRRGVAGELRPARPDRGRPVLFRRESAGVEAGVVCRLQMLCSRSNSVLLVQTYLAGWLAVSPCLDRGLLSCSMELDLGSTACPPCWLGGCRNELWCS